MNDVKLPYKIAWNVFEYVPGSHIDVWWEPLFGWSLT